MSEKITRRQLGGVAAGAVVAVAATAQVPDLDSAARESVRQDAAVLAKFEIPMSLEPAFQFKA